ncbi:helix-turn-helix domain-containing protein [Nisaea nitritireducens]|uniref:helix-turn-helix domain-containing protein n=1 Tax=Nisaea nitritireducens TaxID=568392 RepID=UPI0018666496|nr:helix-turn-helix domain-containing protein [Nisaea nitritireducens]
MSAKAKLRLQHIEDAAKSKAEERMSPVVTAVAVAPTDIALKATKSKSAEPWLNAEAESASAVGELLRHNRVERELSLQDIAQQLRIQRSYLEALEEGDFDSLPGLTYAIGYVRSYAQLLDLDQDTLIADFKAEAKKLQEPTQLSFPSPAPEGKVPGGALVFAGVLLAALSYGGWYYFSTSETAVSELTPGIPDRLAFLLEEPAINTPAAAESAPVAPQPTAAIAVTKTPAASKAPSAPIQAASEAAPSKPETEPVTGTTPAPVVASVSQEPTQQAETPAAAVTATDTTPAAPEIASTTNTGAEEAAEIAAAPPSGETITATEPVTEASAPVDTAATEDTTAAVQVASIPEPAPASGTTDIPAIPEVPLQAATTTSRSVVEAEAAAIDSKPKPASTVAGPLIVISATDDSWVQVRGTDASPLLTRILRKGEQYKVPARTGLKLFTGNAGALKISVNGTEAPSLGPFGKIARNIPLDETLLTYTVTD